MLLGSQLLLGHVAQTARPYLYSTAPAPAMAAAMRVSLRLMRAEPWRRAKLASLVARFRRGASAQGLPLQESFTAIQPIVLGDNARALAASRALELDALDESLRPLQQRIYALQDESVAASKAAEAAAQAAVLKDARGALDIQIMQLSGREADALAATRSQRAWNGLPTAPRANSPRRARIISTR
jgi:hypothetical protein